MRRKVCIIGTRGYPSYYGGFETAVRKLAPFLADENWDVVVYGRPGAVRADDETAHLGVRSVLTKGFETKSLSTLSFGLTASLYAARRKPDVALIMNVANGFWLPLLRLRGIPTVVNVDGIEWERAKWGTVAKKMFKLGAWLTAKFADVLVYDSKEIARRWKQDYGREGVFIPYGGEPDKGGDASSEFPRGSYVLLVARFVPENTIGEFFESVPAIAEKYQVVLVGSEGYPGDFDTKAAELSEIYSNVTWLGHLSDDERLTSLWRNCGLYFHGHSVGGTNPALVQAMALGAPTLARDTVYNREVLADSGVFVLPSADSIIEGINVLMSDDRRRQDMSERAKNKAALEYGWGQVNGRYEDAFELAIDKRTTKQMRGQNGSAKSPS